MARKLTFEVECQASPVEADIVNDLAEIKAMLRQILEQLGRKPEATPKLWHSVEEAAGILGRAPYTIRDYCRLGRLNATKRGQKWGKSDLWSISSVEIERYRQDGLLSLDPLRNS
jgi:hypothetical protein